MEIKGNSRAAYDLGRLFQKESLIPAVAQDAETRAVLMLGYVNREALTRTLSTGTAWFWSRSRQVLWNKGETSGHVLYVRAVWADCDEDTLLYLCDPVGPVCHTGAVSCFFRRVSGAEGEADSAAPLTPPADVWQALDAVVRLRRAHPQEGSYTCYLFEKGLDKILKKVGEETAEVLIAAKNGDNVQTAQEICDLIYHLLVLMAAQDLPLAAVTAELTARRAKIGNRKSQRVTDRNT
ncbi:MAG: bifunctional phosphoribosyl-AMP cyclohydrolase/phosphoribosyl-ATP diphosphatase HisIE [Oscillospiraceae bacterium]|jgi:phosphoribosyl-ATP pyrophosphohydrolase/phosphoribosyl-AMP cyclohydrolase|nr:bifunctional phosphoribosyl-AMP cyclohydrolase/phosphoribosyl-ATP diphosphatase HisIE [Oscillospiraceae bacterium]